MYVLTFERNADASSLSSSTGVKKMTKIGRSTRARLYSFDIESLVQHSNALVQSGTMIDHGGALDSGQSEY